MIFNKQFSFKILLALLVSLTLNSKSIQANDTASFRFANQSIDCTNNYYLFDIQVKNESQSNYYLGSLHGRFTINSPLFSFPNINQTYLLGNHNLYLEFGKWNYTFSINFPFHTIQSNAAWVSIAQIKLPIINYNGCVDIAWDTQILQNTATTVDAAGNHSTLHIDSLESDFTCLQTICNTPPNFTDQNGNNNSIDSNGNVFNQNGNDTLTIQLLENTNVTFCYNTIDDDNDSITVSQFFPATNGSTTNNNNCITYTPNTNYVGSDVIKLIACDSISPDCDTLIVQFTINEMNRAPQFIDSVNNTVLSDSIFVNLVIGQQENTCLYAADSNNNNLTFSLLAQPQTGIGSFNQNCYSYSSASSGTYYASFSVCDNGSPVLCDSLVIVYIVNAPVVLNNAPVILVDSTNLPEADTMFLEMQLNETINQCLGFFDADNDLVQFIVFTNVTSGSLYKTNMNCFTYNPSQVGTHTCMLLAYDNGTPQRTDSLIVQIKVNPIPFNSAPVFVNVNSRQNLKDTITHSINEADTNTNCVGIYDLENDNVTTFVLNGAITLNNDSCYKYTYSSAGTYFNTIITCDNKIPNSKCDTLTIKIVVIALPFNNAPVFIDKSNRTALNDTIEHTLLVNENFQNCIATQDIENNSISFSTLNGAININNDTCYTYGYNVPGEYYSTILACDNGTPISKCDTLVIKVTVNNLPNTAPIINVNNTKANDTLFYYLGEEEVNTTCFTYSDNENNEVVFSVLQTAQIGNGNLSNDCYAYSSPIVGIEYITVLATDNGLPNLNDTIVLAYTVTQTTSNINIAPIAHIDYLNTTDRKVLTIEALINDKDFDNDSISLEQAYLHSSAKINIINNVIEYTPIFGKCGRDTITYIISDNKSEPLYDTAFIIIDLSLEDSDADNIPDFIEGLTLDTDNDGIKNYLDIDSDNDGILDYIEMPIENMCDVLIIDTDADGIPDYLDLDSDNDTKADEDEGVFDCDNDGFPNYIDFIDDCDNNEVFVPNAFTPNYDGINDEFKVIASNELKNYNLLIFDRFGNAIFNSSDINQHWNGKINNTNTELPVGMYVYRLSYKFDTETIVKQGQISLL